MLRWMQVAFAQPTQVRSLFRELGSGVQPQRCRSPSPLTTAWPFLWIDTPGRSTVPDPENPFQPLFGKPISPHTRSIFIFGLYSPRRNPRIRKKCGSAPLPPIQVLRTVTCSISQGTRFETTITPSPRNIQPGLLQSDASFGLETFRLRPLEQNGIMNSV